MGTDLGRDTPAETAEPDQPRFGSYIGLFYTAAIIGILSFAVFFDAGQGSAFDRLQPGMTPTEAAAILGSPRIRDKSEARLVQTWHIADGSTFEVRFEQGKLTAKQRLDLTANPESARPAPGIGLVREPLKDLGESRDRSSRACSCAADRLAPVADLASRLGSNLGTSPGIQLPAQVVRDLAGDVDEIREDVQRLDGPDVAPRAYDRRSPGIPRWRRTSGWIGCCGTRPWRSPRRASLPTATMIAGPQ